MDYNWKSERERTRTAKQIIDSIIKQLTPDDDYLTARLEGITMKVDAILKALSQNYKLQMLSGDRIFNALQFLDTVKSILLNNGLLFLSKKSLLS